MMPEHVAVALRPPKSAAAVPAISEVTPITAMEIPTAAQPSTHGEEYNEADIARVIRNINPLSHTTGGARRDWKNRSEIIPPANPPMMPNTHSNNPQFFTM